MTVTIRLEALSAGDLRDLERLLLMIRRQLNDPGVEAIRRLLHAIDVQRSIGHRKRGEVAVQLFSGQGDPEAEDEARLRLLATLEVGRDTAWLSDALRVFINELLCQLVDARSAAVAEKDALRRLYAAPAYNPRDVR